MLATTRYLPALVRTAATKAVVTGPRGEPQTTTAAVWVDLERRPWTGRLHDELRHLGRGGPSSTWWDKSASKPKLPTTWHGRPELTAVAEGTSSVGPCWRSEIAPPLRAALSGGATRGRRSARPPLTLP